MVKDHLPEGEYDQLHDNMLRETNQYPRPTLLVKDRVFAQLERLLREKPNTSLLTLAKINNKSTDKLWLKGFGPNTYLDQPLYTTPFNRPYSLS